LPSNSLSSSAVRSPNTTPWCFFTQPTMASSRSAPPRRSDWLATMPPRETTATSVRPPPTTTTMLPTASWTGRPTPMAPAMGSSTRCTGRRAPADSAASCTARCSTAVIPEGTHTSMRGRLNRRRLACSTKWRSIRSHTSRSAMTPACSGLTTSMWAGVRPCIRLASAPTASTRRSAAATATSDGSSRMMPRPRT
jgi:hypothetical protein